jgi:hypothetical protein
MRQQVAVSNSQTISKISLITFFGLFKNCPPDSIFNKLLHHD